MTKKPDQSLTPIAFAAHAKTDYFITQHGTQQNHVFDTPVKTDSVDQLFMLLKVDFWVIAIAELFRPNCYFLRLHVHKSCAYMITQTQTTGYKPCSDSTKPRRL